MQNLKLTLLQMQLHWHDAAANREAASELIDAEAHRSDLIVLPETFTSGFTMEAATVAEDMTGASVIWLRQQAVKHNTAICAGMIVSDEGRHYNRLLWAQPDGTLHSYDKRHLFRMVGERDVYTPGNRRLIVEVAGWRVCPLICYDLRFPVWSRNREDYDLLLYIANWPAARRSAWETLLPARAVENLCYAAGVNCTGTDGNGVDYVGGSMVADYLGQRLIQADEQPAALNIELDMSKLLRFRDKFPAWKDADDFSLSDQPAP